MFYNKEVIVKHPNINFGREIELSVDLGDSDSFDCNFGHFGYNFWFRTPYGIKGKNYKTSKTMESAISKTLKNNGFVVLGWK